MTASMPLTWAVCSETGRPHAFSARYASCSVFGREALGAAEAVADHPELAPGGDRRILLPQRPGRAVARIGERRLTLLDQTGVEVFEVGDPEEHFAAHLEHRGTGNSSDPVSRSGTSSMVRALRVTSSPVRPSPRVAARSSRPSR